MAYPNLAAEMTSRESSQSERPTLLGRAERIAATLEGRREAHRDARGIAELREWEEFILELCRDLAELRKRVDALEGGE